MSFTSLALTGFASGVSFAAVVASLMAGYYATTKALSEL